MGLQCFRRHLWDEYFIYADTDECQWIIRSTLRTGKADQAFFSKNGMEWQELYVAAYQWRRFEAFSAVLLNPFHESGVKLFQIFHDDNGLRINGYRSPLRRISRGTIRLRKAELIGQSELESLTAFIRRYNDGQR